jgi:hypothetical protein
MIEEVEGFWTDQTSVLFTSLWGWTPETWGTIGWSGNRGYSRRKNLLKQLTDPFICVCYVTSNKTYIDPDLKGMIAGFYLVSHQTGDRNDFTHPKHHGHDLEKWRHSLRAIRAFSYLPEYRLSVPELDPTLLDRARSVSAMGEILTGSAQIALLKETPWKEVEIYTGQRLSPPTEKTQTGNGWVQAGPASKGGYEVSSGTQHLPRELYILQLSGDTDAYLGRPAEGKAIYKIGLSVSPESRRQAFQKSMPHGAFSWKIERTSRRSGLKGTSSFEAAVAGEDAMKKHLAYCSEWLGGEFYLATEEQINEAWKKGNKVTNEY